MSRGSEEILTSGLVLGRHIQDAICIYIKHHIDLRYAARSRRDATQLELAKKVVVARTGPLSLKDLPSTAILHTVLSARHYLESKKAPHP